MRLFIIPVVSLLAVGSLHTVTYAIPMDPQRQLVRGFRSSTPKPCETDETYFFSVCFVGHRHAYFHFPHLSINRSIYPNPIHTAHRPTRSMIQRVIYSHTIHNLPWRPTTMLIARNPSTTTAIRMRTTRMIVIH
ncbi:hypothetical protein EV361DRAFT_914886 [Lentinula raphanica]|nr:hypothetical protein EV361DRAFT_914886 [Lentinula raphanica]